MKKIFILATVSSILSVGFLHADIVRGVNGNWGPIHNTRNFRYVVVKGDKDYYKHKRSNRTVGTKCARLRGHYVVDYYKNGRDACVEKTYKPIKPIYSATTIGQKKCYKYKEIPRAVKYSYSGVHGNWAPWHNTNKFRYVVVRGDKDYYKHKRKNRTVGTKCRKNEGTYVNDFYSDGRDACRKPNGYKACPSGYKTVGNMCRKLIGSTNAIRKKTGVHGNWGPIHNTRNFRYVVVKGDKDYYKHKRSNRTVGTKCKKNEGTYMIDAYSNGRDACVKWDCPPGYSR